MQKPGLGARLLKKGLFYIRSMGSPSYILAQIHPYFMFLKKPQKILVEINSDGPVASLEFLFFRSDMKKKKGKPKMTIGLGISLTSFDMDLMFSD